MRSWGLTGGCAFGMAFGLVTAGALLAADEKTAPAVAATVNGEPIYVAEVNVLVRKMVQTGNANAAIPAATSADMLKQIINRRLAAQAMKREGGFFTEEEIKKELDKIKSTAAINKMTLEQLAAKQGVSENIFREEAIWRTGWERYVERHLTDEMESYFKAHKRDYDGSQVRASHILFRPEQATETNKQLVERANQVREQIESGKLAFEEAAEKYSAGPSGRKGGDLGWIARFGVMFEEFAKAAYQTEKGQISQPVTTPFGVHLIKVTDMKPGTKQWTEVVEQMRPPASVDLFERLAKNELGNAKIEFTGKMPYFKPVTNELVIPPAAAK